MNDGFSKVRICDILHTARTRQASDVHIAADMVPMLRVDGSLEIVGDHRISLQQMQDIALQIFDEAQQVQLRASGDVTCTSEFQQIGPVRMHASTTSSGLCIAFRILDREIPALETLGLPDAVRSFATAEHGLVLLAGATGCGKSTSLAALIEHINTTTARRIISLEDPIEYRHTSRRSLITQREIGRDVATFSIAILEALRGDPDIIVVGEMRDEATMRAVLVAAETGHLVFATLHTGHAAQTIDRIIDAFSESNRSQVQAQIAQVLVAVLCQRLVPRPNGRGRRAIAEILVATDAVRNLIRERKTHQLANVIATGHASGMQSFEQHLAKLARDCENQYVMER